MEVIIPILVILNLTLATALFVAKMAQLDRRYTKNIRREQAYKSFFRNEDQR